MTLFGRRKPKKWGRSRAILSFFPRRLFTPSSVVFLEARVISGSLKDAGHLSRERTGQVLHSAPDSLGSRSST
jgi:hypothetical protein